MAPNYQSINYSHSIPNLSGSFQIVTPPQTDVWEKPPSTHSFNAPIIYTTSTVVSFKSARVTVTADWREKYDQGGLALIINNPDGTRQWVKSEIELLNGEPHVSTVATDRWSDWSLRPTLGGASATIEIEKNEDGSLWVWLLDSDGTKVPAREVAWWGDVNKDSECWVGVYAAKPAKEESDLVVKFDGLSISTV